MSDSIQGPFIVTGASGQLGRQVVENLLAKGANPVVAITRTPDKLADLRARGQIDHVGEEMGFVLEGQIELLLDDEVFVLGVGDAFHFKSHRKHGYRNPGVTRARILWANTPPTF